jgi:hypothetical protein
MCGEDHSAAFRYFICLVDEDDALLLEGSDNVLVVNDLFADVDGSTVKLEGFLNSDHCAINSCAISTRGGQKNAFS